MSSRDHAHLQFKLKSFFSAQYRVGVKDDSDYELGEGAGVVGGGVGVGLGAGIVASS